jgi:hypothetical protein
MVMRLQIYAPSYFTHADYLNKTVGVSGVLTRLHRETILLCRIPLRENLLITDSPCGGL